MPNTSSDTVIKGHLNAQYLYCLLPDKAKYIQKTALLLCLTAPVHAHARASLGCSPIVGAVVLHVYCIKWESMRVDLARWKTYEKVVLKIRVKVGSPQ